MLVILRFSDRETDMRARDVLSIKEEILSMSNTFGGFSFRTERTPIEILNELYAAEFQDDDFYEIEFRFEE